MVGWMVNRSTRQPPFGDRYDVARRMRDLDEVVAAAGICAHESAMKDGELVYVPRFCE